jgi:hypothetical protein
MNIQIGNSRIGMVIVTVQVKNITKDGYMLKLNLLLLNHGKKFGM